MSLRPPATQLRAAERSPLQGGCTGGLGSHDPRKLASFLLPFNMALCVARHGQLLARRAVNAKPRSTLRPRRSGVALQYDDGYLTSRTCSIPSAGGAHLSERGWDPPCRDGVSMASQYFSLRGGHQTVLGALARSPFSSRPPIAAADQWGCRKGFSFLLETHPRTER
jgi:hypothetical protein